MNAQLDRLLRMSCTRQFAISSAILLVSCVLLSATAVAQWIQDPGEQPYKGYFMDCYPEGFHRKKEATQLGGESIAFKFETDLIERQIRMYKSLSGDEIRFGIPSRLKLPVELTENEKKRIKQFRGGFMATKEREAFMAGITARVETLLCKAQAYKNFCLQHEERAARGDPGYAAEQKRIDEEVRKIERQQRIEKIQAEAFRLESLRSDETSD